MKTGGKVLKTYMAGLVAGLFFATPLFAGGSDMSINEAAGLVAKKKGDAGFVILDVRTPGEFDDGHLEGAINIDVNSGIFDDEIMKLDKKKNYLIYCRSGKRSKKAQGIMGEAGFKDTINMKGGFLGWVEEGHPFEK